jgi:hypothetical protein
MLHLKLKLPKFWWSFFNNLKSLKIFPEKGLVSPLKTIQLWNDKLPENENRHYEEQNHKYKHMKISVIFKYKK